MFGIFKRRNKVSVKELYQDIPLLDKMWMCVARFCPWNPDGHGVKFVEVSIKRAEAEKNGIYVHSPCRNPFDGDESMSGYIDKITSQFGYWVGFFETKDEAVAAYNKLMDDWVKVIQNKKVAT